jgi:hypothetical protein
MCSLTMEDLRMCSLTMEDLKMCCLTMQDLRMYSLTMEDLRMCSLTMEWRTYSTALQLLPHYNSKVLLMCCLHEHKTAPPTIRQC